MVHERAALMGADAGLQHDGLREIYIEPEIRTPRILA